MADKKTDTWFGSLLTAAKNKSAEVMEFVHKDLEEFGTAAGSIVTNTGNAIGKTLKFDEPESTAGTMKRSISSFLGSLNEVLNPTPDDSDTEAVMITEDADTVKLTAAQQAVYNLQKSDDTFLQDPCEDATLSIQYQCWLGIFNEELNNDKISKLLMRSNELKGKYTKLVPDIISNEIFWKRYLFRKALVEDEIAQDEENAKRKLKEKDILEENVEWEKEDFANDIVLTEEDQIRLLEQYDNELKEKQTNSKHHSKSDRKAGKCKENEMLNSPNETRIHPEPNVTTTQKSPHGVSNSENISSNSSTDGDWEQVPQSVMP